MKIAIALKNVLRFLPENTHRMEDVDIRLVFPLFLYPFGFSVIDRITAEEEEGREDLQPLLLLLPLFSVRFFLLVNSPFTRYAIQLYVFLSAS